MRRNDTLFLEQKLKRQIQLHGSEFKFTHKGEDKYHRPLPPTEISITGIYHETVTYQSKNTSDGSTTHKKSSPLILCSMTDGKLIATGDALSWNDAEYRVTGIEDIQQFGVACQISLEVIAND